MSPAKIALSVVVMFVATWLTDFLIHAVLLSADYGASKELWRSESDMVSHMGWMFLGQFLAAACMTIVYARGFAHRRSLKEACLFGLLMGLFGQAFVPIFYAVQPLPAMLCVKWIIFGAIQGVILGLVLFAVCKPNRESAPVPA
jgi:tryptophan-rich sensory protein